MSSLYSHITLGRISSVKQRLNGSPFYRETPLNKKQRYKEFAQSLKSTNAPNGENSETKLPENRAEFTELVFFTQSLQSGIFSHINPRLKEHYVFIPWFFFRKCCPPAHLWPFQSPSLCMFLFLQPTHYELQDLYE